ncbi:MBG domain-containing protein [Sphingomonas sp. 35-24ZXX]|uniref:MBG domain-containing protein n=1 Tax=Sphingomonas sp. 35-24ZXX TaxID=1545915 RepID=UPI00053BFF3A|nr:MBG domain-containing protein [Sphingomonas sp. 35-24ZXX]
MALRTGVAGLAFVSAQTAMANPSGGTVVAGSASINGQGTDRVRIDQSSDRVVINWDNFSINLGQGVDFRQPNARSIALNRVTGPEISQIMGELTANGQIYLINGNGIVFGKDAKVDVASLVASSADIANEAFMGGGALRFGTPGRAGAKVINHGTITVRDAGIAAFVAPQVANDGIITAQMGRIAFGGAQAFTLDLHGDNLIRFQVGDAVKQIDDKGALVAIDGVVDARGGSLQITASAARDLVNQSVRIGTPQASAMQVGADGKVSLVAAKVTIAAPGEVQVGKNVAMDLSSGTNAAVAAARSAKDGNSSNIGWVGSLDGDAGSAPGQAMATNGTGGTLSINAARTILDGTINLDGSKTGGTAHITGSDFLSFGSILSASGAEAGGKIKLDAGGFSLAGRITVNAGLGKGGSVDIHTTRRAIDTGDAFIDASGLHGGTIRYTSDQQIISSGKFRASGSHGFGGNIDVSAPRLDLFSAQFYAQGGIRGGRVRLGGEFQGGKALSVDELLNARTLVATDAVTIDVSAIGMRGNAGEIVVWSDEKTTFLGNAIARGGLVGGLGGQIEISGKETLVYRGTVETARDGQRGGKLLLDPKNIIIADATNSPSQYGLVLQAFASSFPGPSAPQPGLKAGDSFGTAVSLDGNRLAVGVPLDDGADGAGNDTGAVYLFTFEDESFGAPILSSIVGRGYTGGKNVSVASLNAGEQFGFSVSLADTRLAVGAPFASGNPLAGGAADSGVVYLIAFGDLAFNGGAVSGILGSGFSGSASLDVTNLEVLDGFGSSVSLNGDRLAVGALADNGAGDNVMDAGAVYLFTFADSLFNAPVLEAIMGAGYTGGKNVDVTLEAGDFFGTAVSLSGLGLAVGAPGDDGQGGGQGGGTFDYGAAYLYSFSSFDFTGASLESTLGFDYSGPNDVALGQEAEDRFGASLGLIGGASFAVLADGDDGLADTATDSGAAYLFTFSAPFFQGPLLAGIIGADYGSLGGRNLSVAGLEAGDTIFSLSLGFNGLVLGVSNDDGRSNALTDAGAVYLFTFGDGDFNDGRQVGTLGAGYADFNAVSLIGSGLNDFDRFGAAVSLDGNRLAVGAANDGGAFNDKPGAGAVYLFTFGDALFSAPTLQATIGAGYTGGRNLSVPRLASGDFFGTSVSLDGLNLAVGAPGDNGRNNDALGAGAVYLFAFDSPDFFAGLATSVLSFESFAPGLIASEGAQFGAAVSLSGNVIAVGATGDPGNDPMAPLNSAGAVHIIDLGSTNPSLLATIGKGYDGGTNVDVVDIEQADLFGSAVSLDGLRLAVGAPGDDGFGNGASGSGTVYLLTFGDSSYTGGTVSARIGIGYVGASDFIPLNLAAGDAFGSAVSLSGLQLVVGAPGDDGRFDTQNDAGAVYLFTSNDIAFNGIAQPGIIGADYAAGFSVKLAKSEDFGSAVSFDAGRLVVGAPGNPGLLNSAPSSGAAYLFSFAGNNFSGVRLHDTLGAGYSGQRGVSVGRLDSGDQFGGSVSLDGTRLAVGAPFDDGASEGQLQSGAVYLFSFADLGFGSPVLQAIIGSGYTGGKNIAMGQLEASDLFGSAVSLDGLQLAVGAPGDEGASNGAGEGTGAVYLFTFTDQLFGGGALEATVGSGYAGIRDIAVANLAVNDGFGRSVSLDQNRLAVGAPGDDGFTNPASDVGAVYLFSFTDSVFSGGVLEGTIGLGYVAGLKDLDISASLDGLDLFGTGVALDGLRLFAGAPGDRGAGNSLSSAGAVYGFQFGTLLFGTPSLSRTIGAGYTGTNDTNVTSVADFDRFGSSVSVFEDQLAIGAIGDGGLTGSIESAGAVYLFLDSGDTYGQFGILGAGYGGDNDHPIGKLEVDDFFGSSVSLNQNRLAVGAIGDDGVQNTTGDAGGVYLFRFANSSFGSLSLTGTLGTGYGPAKNLDLLGDLDDNLGASVALLGNRLAIGVPGAPAAGGGGNDIGAVYLFTFADAAFSTPTLTGILGRGYGGAGNFDVSLLENGDRFGASLSIDGLRLAVGAPGDNGANNDTTGAGAVYLFSFADTSFGSPVLEARVGRDYTGFKNVAVALDADDAFGTSVSLAGTQLAVGTPGDDGVSNVATDAGAAILFNFTNLGFNGGERAGTIGVNYSGLAGDFDLTALDANDRFGTAVAQSGLALVVGAPGDQGNFNVAPGPVGAVYTFLFADVDFDGPTLNSTIGLDYVVGSGTPFDVSIGSLEVGDDFGAALAFDGLQLVIGAPGDEGASNRSGPNTGAVYQLAFQDSSYTFIFSLGRVGRGYAGGGELSVSGLESGDRFGTGLTLNAGRLVVGAPGDDGVFEDRSAMGAAYLFTAASNGLGGGLALAGTIGSGYGNGVASSLAAQGIASDEQFATSVALDGLRLAIGSSFDAGASSLLPFSGAVYLFTFADLAFGAPVLQSTIGNGYTGGKNLSVASLDADDFFGGAVSLRGTQLAVGARGDDGAANSADNAGAVYLFSFADLAFSDAEQRGILGQGYAGGSSLDVAGLETGDQFGASLSLDQQLGRFRLAVGATGDDGENGDSADVGAIYVFSFVDDLFNAPAVSVRIGRYNTGPGINISGGDQGLRPGDNFGSAVALSGLRLAGGAAGSNGFANVSADSGAVYLLTFADADFGGVNLPGIIGRGFDVPGSAFDIATLDTFDGFGSALSLDGNRLAVGAPGDDGFGNGLPDPGAVYLFSFADESFGGAVREATIGSGYTGGKTIAVPLDVFDLFGTSVALDGNRMVVGARDDDGPNNAQTNTGAMYLFTFADADFNGGKLVGTIGAGYRSTVGLDLAAPVTPTSAQVGGGDGFGSALSLDSFRLAIGAPNDDGSIDGLTNAGAVYLFTFANDSDFSGASLEAVIGHGYVGGKNLFVTQIDANDNFGSAVSLDGNRLAVGAPGDDGAGNGLTAGGAVYLFSFADVLFAGGALEGIIGSGYTGGKNVSLASTLEDNDQFGSSVSLKDFGLAVGAPGDDGNGNSLADSGAAYLFTFADAFFLSGTLAGTLGAGYTGGNNFNVALDVGDLFASALSLDGTRLAVGARGDDGSGNGLIESGAAYLFTFDDVNFTNAVQRGIVGASYSGAGDVDTVLTPFGFASGSFFGSSIALDGTNLAIGGPGIVSAIASPAGSGAVYLLTFTDTVFSGGTIAEVLAKGAPNFGANLDLDVELDAFDEFGSALSLKGGRLVVGAAGDDGFGNGAASTDSGAVYLFNFNPLNFSSMQLRGNIGAGYTRGVNTSVNPLAAADAFGAAISLNGNRLAVGAPGDDGLGDSLIDSGAVYLFTFADADFAAPSLQGIIGAGYTGGKNLSVSELREGTLFGTAVSLDGDRLAVGASGDAGASASRGGAGAAYLFTFADAAFTTPALASIIGLGYAGGNNFGISLDTGDQLGSGISLSGTRLAIGAVGDDGIDDGTPDTGAVYLFNFADMAFSTPTLAGNIGRGYSGAGDFDLTGTLGISDAFGSSVSLDGDRLAVGAALDDGLADAVTNAGAVYLFTFADSAFSTPALARTLGAQYTGANGVNGLAANERFGSAVALKDNLLAVGATFDQPVASSFVKAGVVHLFSFSDTGFVADPARNNRFGNGFETEGDIDVAGIADGDLFGSAISIDTGRLVIGAVGDDGPDNQVTGSGAVYFFALSGGALPGLNFADNPGADVTISASALATILAGGTAVELQANNDITVTSAILVDNPSGNGGNLTFRAGRSILINAGIATDGGNFTAVANEFLTGGVIDAFRDPGDAVISFSPDGFVDAGSGSVSLSILAGDDKTFSSSGGISVGSITASSIAIQNLGVSGNRAVDLNANALLTASGAGDAIVVESDIFTNLAGAGVFNLTGGGRFLVYSTDYEVIDRGGLVGDNLYNNVSPGGFAGNLFIFSRQPILTFTADDATRTYGQGSPAYTFQFTGLVNGDSDFYAFSGMPNLFDTGSGNAGIDSILIEQGSLFSDVGYGFDFVAGALTTLRALLTARADDQTRQYGDANPAFTVTYSGFVNGDDEGVILSGPSFDTLADITSDVGTYAITLGDIFTLNYDIDYVPGTLTITKALLTVTADNASREYGLANPTFTGSIAGFRNSDTDSVISGLVYGSVADITSNAGTYAITGSGATATNYDFAYVPGTLTITKALLTVTADNATREYGLADPTFTGSITGFRNSDTANVVSGLVYGSTAVLNSGIGTYAINGSGATSTNYDFAYVPGTLTITRALLTVTADNASREYGLANPTFTGTISGLRAGDTASVVSGLVYGTAATAASNVGTFAITASGGAAANYDFAYAPGTLTITKALLTVTADNASREYGLANPTFTGSITGFRNSDTASVVSGLVYNTVAGITSNAGTYAITGSGATATNYDFAYVPGTLTITKALLTVTADSATREYGLADPTFTGSITGFRNSDTASVVSGLVYGSTAVLNSGIGTYAINGSGATATNYDFAYVPGTLTITRALLTVTADNASREYGLANPTFTGTISGLRAGDTASVVSGLVYGTAATASSNVGTFAITASGGAAANYDFAYAPGTLTITKALLTVTADNASREYGLANPTFTGSVTGFRNSDTASVISGLVYGSAATVASNVGTFAITGSGATATNYDFAYVPGTLTITRALLTVTANNATREYGLADPTFTGSITGFRNSDTASVVSGLVYGSTAVLNSGIGTYAINGSGATSTNYDFSYVPGTLTITRALLTVTADNASREYGLANPTFTGTISGLRAGDTASVVSGLVYGTAATASSNVGTFAITASGGAAANYDFAYAPGTLTITKALLTVTADNASREYGLANPVFTGTISGLRNGDNNAVVSGLVYDTSATTASNVGTFAITASGGSATNYDFAYVPGTLTITRALLTVTADNAMREYGLANPVFTGSVTGFRNGDTTSVINGLVYGSTAVLNSGIGTYAINGSGATATNYDFSYVLGTLTITRALLTVTADNASREYGLANPTFTGTITGLRAGDTASVVSGLTYGSVATAASNVGAYAITGSGAAAANYNFAYVPGTLTITKALLTVTADNASREYGLANPVFTGSISGLRAGDTASVISGLVYGSVATSASNVGNYAITASGGAATNYDFAHVPGTLTITKALLTVTAESKTREYGLANPALTSMISGLRNGDSSAVVTGLVLATSATQATGVGSYAISVSGGSALNYDFNYVPGTLAITPATLTVAIADATRVYGSANPELTASLTGFRNGDDASVVSGLRLRTGALVQSNVGSYLITGSGANAANYRFDYLPGTLTITKALLQVRVNNASREYGLANPEFSARILGFRNGDNASVISGLTFGTPALIGSDVGNYAITASGASALNYDFSYVPGRLTINQARLLITATNLTMTQGSGDPVLTVSYSGLRNGDTADVVTGLVLRSSGGGSAAPGQYIINASRGTARNYQITYRPGVMTVLPATPPAADPPATGSTPPATGGTANPPPVFTFVPPVGGTVPPAANPPADTASGAAPAPAATPPANPAAPQPAGNTAAPIVAVPFTTMPVQGAVIVPVPPENLNPMQLLQGLSAPLPVLVAPESRPDDAAGGRDPAQGDGQGTACAYISLCNGAPVPLWTYQPAP